MRIREVIRSCGQTASFLFSPSLYVLTSPLHVPADPHFPYRSGLSLCSGTHNITIAPTCTIIHKTTGIARHMTGTGRAAKHSLKSRPSAGTSPDKSGSTLVSPLPTNRLQGPKERPLHRLSLWLSSAVERSKSFISAYRLHSLPSTTYVERTVFTIRTISASSRLHSPNTTILRTTLSITRALPLHTLLQELVLD